MKHTFEMPNALQDVSEFHETFDAPILSEAQIPSEERCKLRINLLQEELDELSEAISQKNVVEVADALCDLQYVLSGAVLEFGLGDKFAELFKEIQRSNMSKVCQNLDIAEKTIRHYFDKDGIESFAEETNHGFIVRRKNDHKILKSVEYSPADLQSILQKS